jgi:hypothetical protein
VRQKLLLVCIFSFCAALTCGAVRADGVIPVVNASFENTSGSLLNCGTGCLFNNLKSIPGWTVGGSGLAGSLEPNSPANSSMFTQPVPDGSFVAYSNGGTISQTLGVSVLADSTYTLSVDIGRRLDASGTLGTMYSIALEDGSATLCSTPLTSNGGISKGAFADVILTCTTGSTVTPGALTIVLTSGGNQIDFDNVSLAVATPEPSAVALMVVGLGFVALLCRSSRRKDLFQEGAS